MADRGLETYLNDHLAGATFGADLARRIAQRLQQPALRELAEQVEEDRQTLIELMQRLDVSRDPLKTAGTWAAERLATIKLSGATVRKRSYGDFISLETLSLGVEGKGSMWRALRAAADHFPQLDPTQLDELIGRAEAQRGTLEPLRRAAAQRALAG